MTTRSIRKTASGRITPIMARAQRMLREAGMQLTPREYCVLIDDLEAIANEPTAYGAIGIENAVDVLRERIGGDVNLRGYLDTLLAQSRKDDNQ